MWISSNSTLWQSLQIAVKSPQIILLYDQGRILRAGGYGFPSAALTKYQKLSYLKQ